MESAAEKHVMPHMVFLEPSQRQGMPAETLEPALSEISTLGVFDSRTNTRDLEKLAENFERSSSNSNSSSGSAPHCDGLGRLPNATTKTRAIRKLGLGFPGGMGIDSSDLAEAAQRAADSGNGIATDLLPSGNCSILDIDEEHHRDSDQDRLAKIISSSRFNLLIGVLILANTVVMGMELDQHPIATKNDNVMMASGMPEGIPTAVFDGFEIFFFAAFSLEFLARMAVKRHKLFIEIATYVDLLALMPVVLVVAFNLHASKHLTLLRIVRLLKLLRLVRLFRVFKELRVLVSSLASAMRALVWIGLLLLILVYCAAIWCTMLIGHNQIFQKDDPNIINYEERWDVEVNIPRYWGSVLRSMFTLFQIFTLDDWGEVVRPIIETHHPWMLAFFVIFLFTTTFGLLNLLMGTIVEHAIHRSREIEAEKELLLQEDYNKVMLASARLFSMMDQDGNGMLSAREIKSFLDQIEISEIMEEEMKRLKLKLDYEELLEICQIIVEDWEDEANPNSDGIALEEFVGAAIRLQGPAKSRDVLSVVVTTKASLMRTQACEMKLGNLQAAMREQGQRFEDKLDKVLSLLDQTGQHPFPVKVKQSNLRQRRGSKVSDVSTCTYFSNAYVPSEKSNVMAEEISASSLACGSDSTWQPTSVGVADCLSASFANGAKAANDIHEQNRQSLSGRRSFETGISVETGATPSPRLSQRSPRSDSPRNDSASFNEPVSTRSEPRRRCFGDSMGGSLRAERDLFARNGSRTVSTLLQKLNPHELDHIAGAETAGALREYTRRRKRSNQESPRDNGSLPRGDTLRMKQRSKSWGNLGAVQRAPSGGRTTQTKSFAGEASGDFDSDSTVPRRQTQRSMSRSPPIVTSTGSWSPFGGRSGSKSMQPIGVIPGCSGDTETSNLGRQSSKGAFE